MVWYSHLLKNFPQFVVIHTVKGFGIVNKAVDGRYWSGAGRTVKRYPMPGGKGEAPARQYEGQNCV